MNETLRTVNGRCVLRIERRLAHRPEKVWRALTNPAELSQWFPATVDLELKVGGEVTFSFEEGPSHSGQILELDPPRVFAFDWADTGEQDGRTIRTPDADVLRFELEPDGDGCLLVFTHTFDDRAGAASFASGWQACFHAMEQVLEGKPPGDAYPSAELHDSYVERFGLDEGSVEDRPDGWTVRFERQMTRPIETVWTALLDVEAGSQVEEGGAVPSGFTVDEIPAGAVVEVDAPRTLEYDWMANGDGDAAGRVRWELTNGTGHGARLILTQTGGRHLTHQRSTALATWQSRIDRLAEHLRTSND